MSCIVQNWTSTNKGTANFMIGCPKDWKIESNKDRKRETEGNGNV